MHIHMQGFHLWGVLSGYVPCPSSLEPPTKPVQPFVDKVDKTAIDTTTASYEKVVSVYQEALELYRDWLSDCAQWIDDDARATSILIASEIVGFSTAF